MQNLLVVYRPDEFVFTLCELFYAPTNFVFSPFNLLRNNIRHLF